MIQPRWIQLLAILKEIWGLHKGCNGMTCWSAVSGRAKPFFVTGPERHCPQASSWPTGPTQHFAYWSPGLLSSWAGKRVVSRDTGPYFL